MKIFVLYASAGMGHRSAAEAIYAKIKSSCPDKEAAIYDILDYANPAYRFFHTKAYGMLASRMHALWAFFYWLALSRPVLFLLQYFSSVSNKKFIKLLEEEKPDVIVSTHFSILGAVSCLKKTGRLNSRLFTVITDYNVHPVWVSPLTDGYIVPCDYAAKQLSRYGVEQKRIRVLGIPVEDKFLAPSAPAGRSSVFTVLVAMGSFGFSVVEEIADMLDGRMEVLVVCGKNKKLEDALNAAKYASVKVFGYTKEMHKLMAASRLMITKPGGLSISEALVMELPMVFVDGIPGQETINAQVLARSGCALTPKNMRELKNLVFSLKEDPDKLESMRKSIRKFRKNNTCEEIIKYVCTDSAGNTR